MKIINLKTKMMKSVHIKFLLIFLFIVQSGCTFNSTYINREEDKEEAEKIADKFYQLLESKNYKGTYPMYSPKFWTVLDTTKLITIYKTRDEDFGGIKAKKLKDWKTTRVEGSNESTQYFLEYGVNRTKYEATEQLILEKMNDTIKIIGYRYDQLDAGRR